MRKRQTDRHVNLITPNKITIKSHISVNETFQLKVFDDEIRSKLAAGG